MAWISEYRVIDSSAYTRNQNNERVVIDQEYELELEIKGLTKDKLNTIMKIITNNL